MATPDDLIRPALQKLGVVSAGQPIAAEDSAVVRDSIPGKLEELNQRGLGYYEYEFGQQYVEWLAILVAQGVALEFGASIDANSIALAEQRLRQMQPIYDSTTLRMVPF